MQYTFLPDIWEDYSQKRVLIGLSGGINSAALLCFFGEQCPEGMKPKELFLYYAHLTEHSPDTFKFVKDCVRYARRRFASVQENIIPHPTVSPCSIKLKIEPMYVWAERNDVDCQLVGFVRHEKKRIERQREKDKSNFSRYPIQHWTDEDCLEYVKQVIGWYPAIYDIKERGKRVFTHNNCLPCKNMDQKQLASVKKYFPIYGQKADALAQKLGRYWGREKVDKAGVCDSCERLFQ